VRFYDEKHLCVKSNVYLNNKFNTSPEIICEDVFITTKFDDTLTHLMPTTGIYTFRNNLSSFGKILKTFLLELGLYDCSISQPFILEGNSRLTTRLKISKELKTLPNKYFISSANIGQGINATVLYSISGSLKPDIMDNKSLIHKKIVNAHFYHLHVLKKTMNKAFYSNAIYLVSSENNLVLANIGASIDKGRIDAIFSDGVNFIYNRTLVHVNCKELYSLGCIVSGLSNMELHKKLNISIRTLESRVYRLSHKFGLENKKSLCTNMIYPNSQLLLTMLE